MYVRQTEMHTARTLVPEPRSSEVEITVERLKKCRSPGTDQIPTELIKERGNTSCFEIHKLMNSIWNKEELPQKWMKFITVPIYKKGDKTDLLIIHEYHCYQIHFI
jgi:hypothetical protein